MNDFGTWKTVVVSLGGKKESPTAKKNHLHDTLD